MASTTEMPSGGCHCDLNPGAVSTSVHTRRERNLPLCSLQASGKPKSVFVMVGTGTHHTYTTVSKDTRIRYPVKKEWVFLLINQTTKGSKTCILLKCFTAIYVVKVKGLRSIGLVVSHTIGNL